uniref:Carboxypeptidase n=1 Tax=Acrobeloides nanus TaxID=290746 RepID=A0A914D4Q4_9BILA
MEGGREMKLITSTNRANDPLILWLNGGPGCSSLGGLMTENGPFRASEDGSTLYENPFSWHKVGNVLYLESPRGVGFSYALSNWTEQPYNDNLTATDTVLALKSFYLRFPEFKNRPFFITGESYGGIYVPTLTDALVKTILNEPNLGINLVGVAIGNGELSEFQQVNSAAMLLYFRGVYDMPTYKALSSCCPGKTPAMGNYTVPCDLTQYVYLDTSGNVWNCNDTTTPCNTTGWTAADFKCSQLVEQLGFDLVWGTLNDVYNTYQDCYYPPYPLPSQDSARNKQAMRNLQSHKRSKRDA